MAVLESASATPDGRDGAGAKPMLIVLFCAAFVAAFNENIVNVGLVDIMSTFDVASTTAQWLVTGYMIVTAVVVTVMAFLLKRFRLRTPFSGGAVLLLAGSVGCLIAPDFPFLLGARLLASVGTGIFIPMMMNTILVVAPRRSIGTYLSVGSCMITLGPALGPVISGVMVTCFGWRSAFLIPAIAITVLLVAGLILIREVTTPDSVHLDILSVVLSALGLTAVVLGFSSLTTDPVVACVALACGIALLAGFVLRQKHLAQPLMDLTPLRNPRFSIACILVMVAMMTTFSMSVLLPLYYEGALTTSAMVAGLLILVAILFNSLTALVGGRVMDRRGEWPLLPVGFLVITVGQAAIAMCAIRLAVLPVLVGSIVVYAGVGAVMAPSQTAGLRQLPREMNPHGVAIMSTCVQIAACLGPSLFVGILSSGAAGAAADGAQAAQATGFGMAVTVAAAIALVGTILATFYARRAAQLQNRDAVPQPSSETSPLAGIMKHEVFAIPATATVRDAVSLLVEHGTSGMPIVDAQGDLVGFVSDGDILKAVTQQQPIVVDLDQCLGIIRDDASLDERVARLMDDGIMEIATRQTIAVSSGATIDEVCTLLGDRRIKKMPVVDDGRLVGSVSRGDVTRWLLEKATMPKA